MKCNLYHWYKWFAHALLWVHECWFPLQVPSNVRLKCAPELGGSVFRLVCCVCLGRGVEQCYSHGCLGILILSAPLEQCAISICSAIIIIYISQHLFHLDRFNYNNRNGALWTTTPPHLNSSHLNSSHLSSKLYYSLMIDKAKSFALCSYTCHIILYIFKFIFIFVIIICIYFFKVQKLFDEPLFIYNTVIYTRCQNKYTHF